VNFPPKQIGPFMSEVLVLWVPDPEWKIILLWPDTPVENGVRMF
jgi:tRNA-binding protein